LSSYSNATERAAVIELAVFDVDGVMTGGEIIYSSTQGEIKIFHAQDGLGLRLLKASGCEIAIISSRKSRLVTERFNELGIKEVHQNQKNKAETLLKLMNKLGVERSNVAYVGDDLVDAPPMKHAGLAIAVANAHPLIQEQADWVTTLKGGQGAVREICDMILTAQGKMDAVIKDYMD
jgi:3-deoxy-D-manno-octulosonate 8-phosphate phosphatase (KDO 8-P phosphatase)